MAVANWSSGAMLKAVLLPLIVVLLAVAAGASSAEYGGAVAKSGGRFSETPVGRKLLTVNNWCGSGSAPDYNCKVLLPLAGNATCCPNDIFNLTQGCWDVAAYNVLKCGSCSTVCKAGDFCCKDVCADLLTDKNNCGVCGNKCKGNLTCKCGLCGY